MKIINILEKHILNIMFVGFGAVGIANARRFVDKIFYGTVPQNTGLEMLPSWWPIAEQTLYIIGGVCLVPIIIVLTKRFLKGEKFVPFENSETE